MLASLRSYALFTALSWKPKDGQIQRKCGLLPIWLLQRFGRMLLGWKSQRTGMVEIKADANPPWKIRGWQLKDLFFFLETVIHLVSQYPHKICLIGLCFMFVQQEHKQHSQNQQSRRRSKPKFFYHVLNFHLQVMQHVGLELLENLESFKLGFALRAF